MSFITGDWVEIKDNYDNRIIGQIGKVYEIRDDGSMLVRLTEVGFPMMVIVEENDIKKI